MITLLRLSYFSSSTFGVCNACRPNHIDILLLPVEVCSSTRDQMMLRASNQYMIRFVLLLLHQFGIRELIAYPGGDQHISCVFHFR